MRTDDDHRQQQDREQAPHRDAFRALEVIARDSPELPAPHCVPHQQRADDQDDCADSPGLERSTATREPVRCPSRWTANMSPTDDSPVRGRPATPFCGEATSATGMRLRLWRPVRGMSRAGAAPNRRRQSAIRARDPAEVIPGTADRLHRNGLLAFDPAESPLAVTEQLEFVCVMLLDGGAVADADQNRVR